MLIVEDGTGFSNSESLCSVEFFKTYHALRGTTGYNDAIEDETIEQLLRKATDYIKYRYDGLWASVPYMANQSLPFPRIGFGLPEAIKQACAELALIAKSTPLMPVVTRGKKSVKVGPISVEYDGSQPTATKFIAASIRLSPYMNNAMLANATATRLIRT